MGIPEAQLVTWAKQGSVTQSSTTYNTIKAALEDPNATYTFRNFTPFLQGSYGNDTNIWAESDVDVVMRYNGAFFHDLDELSEPEKTAFHAAHRKGAYQYADFKKHVQQALEDSFPGDVTPSKRALKVSANGNRRSADVLVTFKYRRYHRFRAIGDEDYDEGVVFFNSEGTTIPNYPKQHSANCTAKHQATDGVFKPMIRIFKNLRSKLVDDGKIEPGTAPSYFIEGLIYNVPNDRFTGTTWREIVFKVLKWLVETTDRSEFLCVNEQFHLLFDDSPNCWPKADGQAFIDAAAEIWDNWT
jgi:hypothetical protein